MHSTRFKRAILSLCGFLLSTMLSSAALPKPEETQSNGSLAGQLLIASPEIGDPRFSHTVILIVKHNEKGALGIVINRVIGERSLASLMEAIGENEPGVEGNVRIFAGGPVEPRVGSILHSAEYHRDETIDIDGHVAMTSSAEILRDIGHNKGPRKSLIAFGYAGWAPGQLEDELAQHGWFTIPEDPALIFDDDREKVWDDATARRTFPL